MTMGHTFWPVTRVTRDYSRIMTPDHCSFQSVPLGESVLKIKHHHCHEILRRNNWIELTLWLKLCRKSLQCLRKKTKSWVNESRVLNRDPRYPLRFVDPLDPWSVTRWPIVISGSESWGSGAKLDCSWVKASILVLGRQKCVQNIPPRYFTACSASQSH